MKLSEKQIQRIICEFQDNCVWRKQNKETALCADCSIPAEVISALQSGEKVFEDWLDHSETARQLSAVKPA